ncbi:uncharacterized protein LOC125427799 [Sphaerodactylus townsendi]|uniref:uncharacterized protein LOC125427799 n=1 Tax=Sphaerodactylus townsendi TaxID=933632 RepID=UPI002026AAAB|nr:uncharacterized protein LOC125427799 [Sphaerodactylus townsendi]
MAMQQHLRIREHHRRPITALGYHAARRECLTGFEDGVIKWWDMENGRMSLCTKEHAGRVTQFLSWIQARLLFSASNDSSVIVWAPGGTVLDRIQLGYPIFTLAISLSRHLLLCGSKGRLVAFPLDETRKSGHVVNLSQSFSDQTHTDIVSCIACLDNHIYTAGYDKRLLIFDTYQSPSRKGLTTKHCISRAHRAAITHLLLVRQQETTRVLSGSFDQMVGIWSQDGQLIHRLGPFTGNITALCYVATVGIVWIASGTSQPTLYEPQSGEIVSQFISTFRGQQMEGLVLQQLFSLPDSRHVIGSAKPQQTLVWRYSELGCLTVLPCKHASECLAYAKKEPVLLFSGDSRGILQKWERSYISPLIYSMESFHISEAHLERRGPFAQQTVKSCKEEPQPHLCSSRKWGKAYSGHQSGYSAFRTTAKDTQKEGIGFTRAIFAEELDILMVSANNGNIYLWEFESFNSPSQGQDSGAAPACAQDEMAQESSRECVAGFACRTVLCGHTGMVTALTLVDSDSTICSPYLVSEQEDKFLGMPGDNSISVLGQK